MTKFEHRGARFPSFWRVVRLALAGVGLLAGLRAPASPVRSQHAEAELVAEVAAVAPGEPFWAAVRMKMDPSWHSYWVNYGDSGVPTTIHWQLPPGWTSGPIQWPTPQRLPLGQLMNYGYEGEVYLLVRLTPPVDLSSSAPVNLAANVSWLECADICVPAAANLTLTLPVANATPAPDSTWHAAIAGALAALPQPPDAFSVTSWRAGDKLFIGLTPKNPAQAGAIKDVYFYSADSQVDPDQPQVLHQAAAGWVLEMARVASAPPDTKSLPGVLTVDGSPPRDAAARAYALDPPLDATPPAQFAGVVAAAPVGAGTGGLLEILLLGFVGGLILNIMPCVFPVLGLKVLGFVRQAGADRRAVVLHGLVFTAGVLASMWTLVAVLQSLRAAGAQLGWGFQLQNAGFVLGLAIFFLLFALSLSGVFEAGGSLIGAGAGLTRREGLGGSFFQGVLAVVVATPCTAPVLAPALGAALALPVVPAFGAFTAIALGLASPYLALSLFPGLARVLPRPGAWMETFKQLMAFPLYATVGFLLYTLAGQVEAERFLHILFALVLVALAAWVYGRYATPAAEPGRRRFGQIAALLLLVAGVTMAYWPEQDLGWEPWSAARVAELQTQDLPIYVDFTARWCATCQVNKEVVFHSARVLAAFDRAHVALLRADWTKNDPAITAELARFGRSAVPFDLLYLPGHADPVILPAALTPDIVLNALAGGTPPAS
jgi:thiol:disulfide interchange protein/DsbC/DsbD-like thiol-disulfide interchange protein